MTNKNIDIEIKIDGFVLKNVLDSQQHSSEQIRKEWVNSQETNMPHHITYHNPFFDPTYRND